MTRSPVEIFTEALQRWGAPAQIEMAIEEMAELTLELQHDKRGRSSHENIASEVADVEIMMGQLRVLLGDDLVEGARTLKLARLEQRLAKARAGDADARGTLP